MTTTDPLDLRREVVEARRKFRRGELSYSQLLAVVETYVTACEVRFRGEVAEQAIQKPSPSLFDSRVVEQNALGRIYRQTTSASFYTPTTPTIRASASG